MRIGHGYDVHRFGTADALVLGGVTIAHHRGLLAHSDGDVLIHAVCDALLGAIGQGDIGRHFPDTDDANAGIDSRIILRKVMQRVHNSGWMLANLDTTLVLEAPKMSPHIRAIRDNALPRRTKSSYSGICSDDFASVFNELIHIALVICENHKFLETSRMCP